MGYAFYALADGREAGYGVEATCDAKGCTVGIDRGLDYLCGENPRVEVFDFDSDEYGCGNYHCGLHEENHNCTRPACKAYSVNGTEYCELVEGHFGLHLDSYSGKTFILTEYDEH